MSEKRKRYILPEEEIPHYWYNIQADMVNKPMPPLHPGTKQPLKAEDLYPIFAKELCHQELNQTDAWIEIPEEVREMYKYYRSTPLVRAYGLEKALGTPAHIYFKNESVSPIGSHKLNSALAQAYYCKEEGVTNITTETGAGQWGAALSYAAKVFGLEAAVYQVKISYEQKPYRRSIMQTFGAQVTPSPSMSTRAGKDILTKHPTYQGSLGTAISEAIELAQMTPNCKYTLGSVLSHVTLHQTIIGLEAEKQMEMAGEYPDIVIGCFGVTAVRHKKHIIEPTEDRQSLHIDMVFKNAEHLFIQRILRHSIEVIKSGLCCPADIKCGSDMSTRPVKNGRDFVPISHLLVRHLLNGSAGHNHAVIRFIAHQVKIAIECFHVLHRRIL